MTAWQRRLRQWSRMTSKQKLADMEKEDRRRRKMLRAGLDTGCLRPRPPRGAHFKVVMDTAPVPVISAPRSLRLRTSFRAAAAELIIAETAPDASLGYPSASPRQLPKQHAEFPHRRERWSHLRQRFSGLVSAFPRGTAAAQPLYHEKP